MTTATMPLDAISYVCSLVRQRSAIELDAAKAYLIEARLGPLARRHGFPSITDMVRSLQAKPKPDMQQELVEAMTTNETSFFRDAHPFEALRVKVLPDLLRLAAAKRSLHIWSAACSTGQEAYSIAILIREHFPELGQWNARIYATDLCDDVLQKGRAARFSQIEINRGLPAALLAKYFRRDGMLWQLAPEPRAMVAFTKLNLIERWPPLPPMDVIFLRNVLIYFSADNKKRILERMRDALAPQGVLFLGAAETTMGLDNTFVREQAGSGVFYRNHPSLTK
ncbi:MAG TPA: protein-glutamate O-methyltransferase CheR [Pirellulales bacterium]